MVVRHQDMKTLESIANRIVDDLESYKGNQDILINGPYEAPIKKSARYVSFSYYDSRYRFNEFERIYI